MRKEVIKAIIQSHLIDIYRSLHVITIDYVMFFKCIRKVYQDRYCILGHKMS